MNPTEHDTLAPEVTAAAAPAAVTVDPLAEPVSEECAEEYARYFADREAGRVAVEAFPEGHYVAYHAGQIHDHDADPTALRARVAARLGVHPARIVVDYPWQW